MARKTSSRKMLATSSGKKNSMFHTIMCILMIIIIGLLVLVVLRKFSPFSSDNLRNTIRESFESGSGSDEPTFVMFYADWCGHCKSTKPEFQKLINSYKGKTKIMLINAEDPQHTELVKEQNIKGFPTIRFYPKGLKGSNFSEYAGDRTASAFNEYVNTIVGKLDVAPDNAAAFP